MKEDIQYDQGTVWAPVIITTCNRYEHLRECVESLAGCTHADKTELYISVDFPPDESYTDGWKKVREYVAEIKKAGRGTFKKVTAYFQESNLGPSGNGKFLRNELPPTNEYYIATEDDNIFAPGFLDYMNRMLQLFKNDKSVMAVSGFTYVRRGDSAPIYKCPECLPYGIGYWTQKVEMFLSQDYEKILKDFAANPLRMFDLYRNNKWVFCICVGRLISGNHVFGWTDALESLSNYLTDRYVIYPAKTLSLNRGFDGSGQNCVKDIIPDLDKMVPDDAALFDYDIDLHRIPVTKKRIFPLPDWVKRQARFQNDPLTYILYRIMGRERFLRWRERKK